MTPLPLPPGCSVLLQTEHHHNYLQELAAKHREDVFSVTVVHRNNSMFALNESPKYAVLLLVVELRSEKVLFATTFTLSLEILIQIY